MITLYGKGYIEVSKSPDTEDSTKIWHKPKSITEKGHLFLEQPTWLQKQFRALSDNIITIVVSVVAALMAQYLIVELGIGSSTVEPD